MCLLFFFSHFRSLLLFLRQPGMFFILSLGSLSNDDGDGSENGKKAIGFSLAKKTTLHVHLPSRFFVHFFAVAARLQRESAHTFFRFSVILSSDTLLKTFYDGT